jgi:hypothetical protein
MVPYVTTNVIIIKDRQPVVDMLTKLSKGKPCTPISQSSGAKMRDRGAGFAAPQDTQASKSINFV